MDLSIIPIAVGVIGCVVGVIGLTRNNRKDSTEDAEKRARFEGEIKADIRNLSTLVLRLQEKMDSLSDGFDAEIDRKIKEHEQRYHSMKP